MAVEFHPNLHFEAEAERENVGRVAKVEVAARIAEEVRAIGPDQSGYFVKHVGWQTYGDRVVVQTTDFAGNVIEFGSVNNPPYAPMRRAISALGLRLESVPKP